MSNLEKLVFVLKHSSTIYQVSVYRTIGPLVSFFPTIFHLISSASKRAKVIKFYIHNDDNQVYYCKQNQGAEIYFCLLFLFSLCSISHANVMNMDIFVKDFTGTTLP